MAFLEPVVHEVRRPLGGLFHPKVWFVRYVDDDGDPSYRLLVLTRNLTNDNAWDIAVRLDSMTSPGARSAYNRPSSEFLGGLPGRTVRDLSAERGERVARLAEESRHIALGVPGRRRGDGCSTSSTVTVESTVDFEGRRHLASPPSSTTLASTFSPTGETITVVSRPEELDRLDPSTLEGLDARVIDAMAGDRRRRRAWRVRAPEARGLLSQLHAKMFVIEPWGGPRRHGCSSGRPTPPMQRFARNVEFLVELRGPQEAPRHRRVPRAGRRASRPSWLRTNRSAASTRTPRPRRSAGSRTALRAVAEIPTPGPDRAE